MYTCSSGVPLSPRYDLCEPHLNVLHPNAQRRLYGWLYHKLDLDGMLIFTMNGWPTQFETGPTPTAKDRWPNRDWKVRHLRKKRFLRSQWLIYPAPDGSMWPSLRLDALRDGFEDYEYIHAAKEILSRQSVPGLKTLLEVDESLMTDFRVFALDFATFNRRRTAIARIIEKYSAEEQERP